MKHFTDWHHAGVAEVEGALGECAEARQFDKQIPELTLHGVGGDEEVDEKTVDSRDDRTGRNRPVESGRHQRLDHPTDRRANEERLEGRHENAPEIAETIIGDPFEQDRLEDAAEQDEISGGNTNRGDGIMLPTDEIHDESEREESADNIEVHILLDASGGVENRIKRGVEQTEERAAENDLCDERREFRTARSEPDRKCLAGIEPRRNAQEEQQKDREKDRLREHPFGLREFSGGEKFDDLRIRRRLEVADETLDVLIQYRADGNRRDQGRTEIPLIDHQYALCLEHDDRLGEEVDSGEREYRLDKMSVEHAAESRLGEVADAIDAIDHDRGDTRERSECREQFQPVAAVVHDRKRDDEFHHHIVNRHPRERAHPFVGIDHRAVRNLRDAEKSREHRAMIAPLHRADPRRIDIEFRFKKGEPDRFQQHHENYREHQMDEKDRRETPLDTADRTASHLHHDKPSRRPRKRTHQKRNHADHAARDALESVIRHPQRIECDASGEKPDRHHREHPHIQHNGILRHTLGIRLRLLQPCAPSAYRPLLFVPRHFREL